MLVADAVMDAGQPGLEVGKDEVDDRQILFCHLGIAPLGDGEMLVAALAKTGVTGPVVSGNRGTCGNGTLDEAAERGGAAIGHDGKPNAPGVTTALTLVELCAGFALANLDGAGDQHLVRDAPAFSSRPTTDIAFIDFDVLAKPAANPILIWSNHTGTQLVQDLESGFVTRKPDLALELHGRHAGVWLATR